MNEEVYREEFALEVMKRIDDYNSVFEYQIDVLETYEEAKESMREYDEPLEKDEFFRIICIEYDEDGDEIGFYTLYEDGCEY